MVRSMRLEFKKKQFAVDTCNVMHTYWLSTSSPTVGNTVVSISSGYPLEIKKCCTLLIMILLVG